MVVAVAEMVLMLPLLGQTVAKVVEVVHLDKLLLADQVHPGKVMMEELVPAIAVVVGVVHLLLELMPPLMRAVLVVMD